MRPIALLASLALAGCAGNGPLGNGLGTVVGDVTVTDTKGQTCHVTLRNGKDQTNLELIDLHVCGASIGSLHADRSDGAQAAIAANAQVVTSIAGQLVGLLGSALTMLGVPAVRPPPPVVKPPPVVVPTVPPPPPPPAAMRRPMALPHGPVVAMLEASEP
jgi:hypothetical protein